MKKLILLLTLMLTFPGANIFATAPNTHYDPNKPSLNGLPADVLLLIIRITDNFKNLSATNTSFRELVKKAVPERDWPVINKYNTALKTLTTISWLTRLSNFINDCATLFTPSYQDKFQEAENKQNEKLQLLLFEFVQNEQVEQLITARIIINLFVRYNVDLNTKYSIGWTLTDSDKKPFPIVCDGPSGATLLKRAKKAKYCPAIVQALKEAIEKQKLENNQN